MRTNLIKGRGRVTFCFQDPEIQNSIAARSSQKFIERERRTGRERETRSECIRLYIAIVCLCAVFDFEDTDVEGERRERSSPTALQVSLYLVGFKKD